MAVATLADINSTLLSIKRDTAVTAKRLSGKGTSAEEAKEGLKERTKARDAIAKPTAPKAPTRKSGGGGGLGGLFGKVIDWAKWFGLGTLAYWFREEILKFLEAAFEPFKKELVAWWDTKKKAIGDAWEGVLEAAGFTWLGEQLDELSEEVGDVTGWFSKIGTKIDTWLEGSFLGTPYTWIKDMLLGEMGVDTEGKETGREGGLFGGIAKVFNDATDSIGGYFTGLGNAFKTLFKSLGILDNEGNIKTGAAVTGIGALVFLFTVVGPGSLVRLAFKGIGGLGKLGWGAIKLGFKAIAAMAGMSAVSAATPVVPPVVPVVPPVPGPGTARYLKGGPNAGQKIIMGADKTWRLAATGAVVRNANLAPALRNAGNAGAFVSRATVTAASRAGGIAFMASFLSAPVILSAAAIGIAAYAAYKFIEGEEGHKAAVGKGALAEWRRKQAAGEGTARDKAIGSIVGVEKHDEEMKDLDAQSTQLTTGLPAKLAGASSEHNKRRIQRLHDKALEDIEAQKKAALEKIYKEFEKVGHHKRRILQGVIDGIFGGSGRSKLVGHPDRFPLTTAGGWNPKEIANSYSEMTKWALKPESTNKTITMSLLEKFGIVPSEKYDLLKQHKQGRFTTKEELMESLNKPGGPEEYARKRPNVGSWAKTSFGKERQIQRLTKEIIAEQKRAQEKLDLLNKPTAAVGPKGPGDPSTLVNVVDNSSTVANASEFFVPATKGSWNKMDIYLE